MPFTRRQPRISPDSYQADLKKALVNCGLRRIS
jgi:hypothetical protein